MRTRLQRAVLRRDRSGAAQQPAVHRERHELLEWRRPARDQGRLRVLPQPADRRQLAVVHRLRVRRGFRDRRGAALRCFDSTRPSHSDLRAGRVVALTTIPATRGRRDEHDNHSAFVQDHWTINNRWSADLGARFEHVKAVSTGDINSVNSGRIVPRSGAEPTT